MCNNPSLCRYGYVSWLVSNPDNYWPGYELHAGHINSYLLKTKKKRTKKCAFLLITGWRAQTSTIDQLVFKAEALEI